VAGEEERDVGATSHRWATPTGAPCPRSLGVDGDVVASGDCHGCGFCLLVGGLLEPVA
jgi:hypothetical protein